MRVDSNQNRDLNHAAVQPTEPDLWSDPYITRYTGPPSDRWDGAGRASCIVVCALFALPGLACVVFGGWVILREMIVDSIPGECERSQLTNGIGGVALATAGLVLAATLAWLPLHRGPNHQNPWWLWVVVVIAIPLGVILALNEFHSDARCQIMDIPGFG